MQNGNTENEFTSPIRLCEDGPACRKHGQNAQALQVESEQASQLQAVPTYTRQNRSLVCDAASTVLYFTALPSFIAPLKHYSLK